MRYLIIVLLWGTFVVTGFAQQLYVGLRNNEYAFICFQSKKHYFYAAENSIKIDKPDVQQFNAYIGMNRLPLIREISLDSYIKGTTAWNGKYVSSSLISAINYLPSYRISFRAGMGIRYDSMLGTNLFWEGRVCWQTIKEVALFIEATNHAIYREKEERVNSGAYFCSGNLRVEPMLSFPVNENIRYARLLLMFAYTIPF